MILQTLPPGLGQPSLSAFCVKAMCLLDLSGADWRAEYVSDPRPTPNGKLPVLIDGDRVIPDSDAIRTHLEQRFVVDFNAGLGPSNRALSRLLIRTVEEHLYFAIMQDRWVDPLNWEVIREIYFGAIPAPLRGFVTGRLQRGVKRGLHWHGMGRHDVDALMARLTLDLRAIATVLGDGPFLFGRVPTAADCSVGPMLAGALATPIETPLMRLIRSIPGLETYTARVQDALIPPADQIALQGEAA